MADLGGSNALEWIHIAISALVGIGSIVIGILSYGIRAAQGSIRTAQANLREDLRRIEDKADENARGIAELRGTINAILDGHRK